jgi:2-hydroxycyclohexanecarboxyl-CoA dehydrogenase
VRQAGGKAEAYELDITKGPDVRRVVKEVGEKYGKIHILVNNAGYDEVKIFSESDEEHWDWMIDLNYKGHLHVTHAALPYLKAAGNAKIVYISSDAARVGSTGEAVYAGCKAALMGFAKTLAREEARHGIRVNVICPGLTETPQFLANLADEKKGKIMRSVQKWIPLKRFGKPEEIAKAVLFFVSDDSSFITGQVLSVSGGLTMV